MNLCRITGISYIKENDGFNGNLREISYFKIEQLENGIWKLIYSQNNCKGGATVLLCLHTPFKYI